MLQAPQSLRGTAEERFARIIDRCEIVGARVRSLCEKIGVEQIRGVSDQPASAERLFQQRAGFADPAV